VLIEPFCFCGGCLYFTSAWEALLVWEWGVVLGDLHDNCTEWVWSLCGGSELWLRSVLRLWKMAVWSVKKKARRLGGGSKEEEGQFKRDRAGRIEGGWFEWIEEEGRKTKKGERQRRGEQFWCWLADQFFVALVANQQSMIGCLETKVRLLCEFGKVVLEVWWMRCTWSISCCIWEPEIFDVGWIEQCHYRRIRGIMTCLYVFLWIKSEPCCHSQSCVLRDRCTIESEWGAVNCKRFCILVSWRRLFEHWGRVNSEITIEVGTRSHGLQECLLYI